MLIVNLTTIITLVENIKANFEIREQEKRTFRFLFLHSFLVGLATALYFVEASRTFIVKISIAEMPSAYIASGIAGYLLVRLFKYLQKRAGVVKSFEQVLYLFCLFMILLYLGRTYCQDPFYVKLFAYFGFMLMFAFATLLAVGFAGICLSIFNLSQSKRLLALLGTGEIIASIAGYLIVPILVKAMGSSSYLLLLAAFFSVLSIWPVRKVSAEHPPKKVVAVKAGSPQKFNFAFIWKNPFILYLSLTTLFSIIAVYFIDYSYLISVRYFSQLTGVEIATVVAMVFSVIKVGELFASLFSSSIVASAGMRTSVLLLPLLLIFGAVMAVFSIIFFSASPVLMIFFLFINKWIDRVVRKGITIPSTKIMFQVNSPEDRVQLQNNIDGVISQLSTVICGVLLTALCFIVGTQDQLRFLSATTIVCLAIFLVLLLMSSRLFRIYKTRIQEFLGSKRVPADTGNEELPLPIAALPLLPEEMISHYNSCFDEIDLNNKEKIRELICYYNPSAEPYARFNEGQDHGEADFIRKITKLYYDNQNIFSRSLIIAYFLRLSPQQQLQFFKDVYSISPLRLKRYFLQELCRNEAIDTREHEFYFTELIAQCIQEILWTETAIADLESLGNPDINTQLVAHKQELRDILLFLLQCIHDKKPVQIISGMLQKKEKSEEDVLFACELLENTLRPSLKKIVLPVFEPLSFSRRRRKMDAFFFTPSMSPEDRLQEILMHDFNMLDNYTKQVSLGILYEMDPSQQTVKAFTESNIGNLKTKALGGNNPQDPYTSKETAILNQFANWLALDNIDITSIQRWALQDSRALLSKTAPKDKRLTTQFQGIQRIEVDAAMNTYFELDLISIALLQKTRVI